MSAPNICLAFARYLRLASISNGHLYNLRHSQSLLRQRGLVEKTRPFMVNISERRKRYCYEQIDLL